MRNSLFDRGIGMGALLIAVAAALAGCPEEAEAPLEARVSAVTTWVYQSPEVEPWLEAPETAFVEAYFTFPEGLSEDVYFGVDLEFFEGIDDPIHFPGADWMAFVCVNREGRFGFPYGTASALSGTESNAEEWAFVDLDAALEPNAWYRIRVDADFGARRFVQARVKGPGLDQTLDLAGYDLDYPNYVPFGPRALTFYAFAIRWQDAHPGTTIAFVDDVWGGVAIEGETYTLLDDGFEATDEILLHPYPTSEPWWPEGLEEGQWYYENYNALAATVDRPTRTGGRALAVDATLEE